MHLKIIGSALLALCTSVVMAQESAEPILCRGHYHSEADAVKQLQRMAATYATADEWRDRADRVRAQILAGAQLDPLPAQHTAESCDS